VGAALESPDASTVAALARAGVRWLLVHREDPDAAALLGAVSADSSATRVVDGDTLVLIRLDDTATGVAAAAAPPVWQAVLVVLVDLAVVTLLVVVAVRRRSRSGAGPSVTLA